MEGRLKPAGQRSLAGDVCARVPPDDRGGVQGLVGDTHPVVASSDHIVARALVTKTAEGLYDRHAAHNLVLVNDGGDLYPTHVTAGVVLGNVEQGDAQLDVSGGAGEANTMHTLSGDTYVMFNPTTMK